VSGFGKTGIATPYGVGTARGARCGLLETDALGFVFQYAAVSRAANETKAALANRSRKAQI
jgi:hypothetical protein